MANQARRAITRTPPLVNANDIRAHVSAKYIAPARQAGHPRVTVRVGDVMRDLPGITGVSHVCASLRARVFQEANGVSLVDDRGPRLGNNTELEFALQPSAPAPEQPRRRSAAAMLLELYGSGAEAFRALGGGDAVLARVREGWS